MPTQLVQELNAGTQVSCSLFLPFILFLLSPEAEEEKEAEEEEEEREEEEEVANALADYLTEAQSKQGIHFHRNLMTSSEEK